MSGRPALLPGLVVATYGRHCMVERPDGTRLICHPRGKKSTAVVGDLVQWLPGAEGQGDDGTIEKLQPRRNLFYRQDEIRTKSFAANLDQVLILIAAEPEFSETQLSRALIAAEAERITPLIVLNKQDLTVPFERAWGWLAAYRDMGYRMLPLSLKGTSDSLDALKAELAGKTTLVLGPSGAGKSTLTNHLVPGALAATREISQALNTGKHTTTSTTWYWVDKEAKTALIDSPGFQEFGLHHIDARHLSGLMPDIKPFVEQCKFYNCTHLHEPGCGVIANVKNDASAHSISDRRYKIYRDLFAELDAPKF